MSSRSIRPVLFHAATSLIAPVLALAPALAIEPSEDSGPPAEVSPARRPSILDSTPSILKRKPVIIAVRKVKNLAGRYAEEGRDADNNMIGFWKPSYEIRLAEILSTELANTGNFTVVERENLYEVLAEQNMAGINKKTAGRTCG